MFINVTQQNCLNLTSHLLRTSKCIFAPSSKLSANGQRILYTVSRSTKKACTKCAAKFQAHNMLDVVQLVHSSY